MSLFGNKKKELPPLMTEAEIMSLGEVANYESALNYLIGLSEEEFDKVIKVAGFHRKAYQESAGVLGTPNEPTTFINPLEQAETAEPEFLEDNITVPANKQSKKSKQIAVKD